MNRPKESKLDDHAEALDQWLGEEQITLVEAQERLRNLGCVVSLGRLSEWRRGRTWERTRRQLLEQIAAGARHCQQVEKQFGSNPGPALETLLNLHRLAVLELSVQGINRETFNRVTSLLRPAIDWARREMQRA